jgi:hypothetical protein
MKFYLMSKEYFTGCENKSCAGEQDALYMKGTDRRGDDHERI